MEADLREVEAEVRGRRGKVSTEGRGMERIQVLYMYLDDREVGW